MYAEAYRYPFLGVVSLYHTNATIDKRHDYQGVLISGVYWFQGSKLELSDSRTVMIYNLNHGLVSWLSSVSHF